MINETQSANPQATAPGNQIGNRARRSPRGVAPVATFQSRHRAQRRRRACARRSGFALSARAMEKGCELRLLDLARPSRRIPHRRNAPRVLQESVGGIHGTARPTTSPVTCGEKATASSRSSPSTALTLGARCAGSRSRSSSCARATAASTTLTVRAHPGRPSADSSPITGKSSQESCRIDAGQMPTLSNTAKLVTISTRSGDSKCSG